MDWKRGREAYRTSVSHQGRRESQRLRNPQRAENTTPTNTQTGGVVLFSRCHSLSLSGKLQKERKKGWEKKVKPAGTTDCVWDAETRLWWESLTLSEGRGKHWVKRRRHRITRRRIKKAKKGHLFSFKVWVYFHTLSQPALHLSSTHLSQGLGQPHDWLVSPDQTGSCARECNPQLPIKPQEPLQEQLHVPASLWLGTKSAFMHSCFQRHVGWDGGLGVYAAFWGGLGVKSCIVAAS